MASRTETKFSRRRSTQLSDCEFHRSESCSGLAAAHPHRPSFLEAIPRPQDLLGRSPIGKAVAKVVFALIAGR